MFDVRSPVKGLLLFAATSLLLFPFFSLLFGQPSKNLDVVRVDAYASHEQIHAGDSFQVAIVATIDSGFHINSNSPIDPYLIPTAVKFDESDDIAFTPASYPLPEHKSFSFSPQKAAVYTGKLPIFSRGRLSEGISLGDILLSGGLTYQACDNQSCFMPRTVKFEIPLRVVESQLPIGRINEAVFQQKASFTPDEQRAKGIIEKGLAYAFIAFFLFGLALNLTPCVYPVIPITVSFFASQSRKKGSRVFVLALCYVVGIALVFSVLGLVSALAGKQWGFLFQNPWFVILVTIIVLSMAASMFGAFELTVPSFLMTSLGQSRQGVIGSFVMGLTVGVVIAPCAAGIIIGLVGLVAKLGIVAKGTLLFFVMGLGLGLPYLLLAMSSSVLNRLPESGMWMVWIRKLFGILLIAVALYLLVPQGSLVQDQQGFYLGVLGIFGGLLLGFLESAQSYGRAFRITRTVFGCLLIVVGALLVNEAIHRQPVHIDWVEYDGQSVAELQKDNKPILIDFYADWCTACKRLDQETFSAKGVAEEARQFVMVRANCTSPDHKTRLLTKRFGVSGLPTIVFLNTMGQEVGGERLVGFLGPEEMLQKMKRLAMD
ncbi:MAG: cytochrome c biogenesis protein CcdA [Thermodesulfobacteriota bacterium]|nr:cytochrome c biogenesis protein CcdA [Thermodesulfobacteriota bacterium]